MEVVINYGKSDILKGKQVVSLVKRFSNKFFQCDQSSPPASSRSLQLPFVSNMASALSKGHCHAIWQFYKKPGVFASVKFKN